MCAAPVLGGAVSPRRQDYVHLTALLFTNNAQRYRVTGFEIVQASHNIADLRNGVAVDGSDEVPTTRRPQVEPIAPQSRNICRAAGTDEGNVHSLFHIDIEVPELRATERPACYPEPGPQKLSRVLQVWKYVFERVARNRELFCPAGCPANAEPG